MASSLLKATRWWLTRARKHSCFFSSDDCLRANVRGSMVVELAITLPVLIMLIFGAVEMARYIMIIQKVDKTVYTLADVVASAAPATIANQGAGALNEDIMDDVLGNLDELMAPYDTSGRAGVIVSSVYRAPGPSTSPRIAWTYGYSDNSAYDFTSVVSGLSLSGSLMVVSDVAADFSDTVQTKLSNYGGVREDENFIAVEVGYYYEPIIGDVLEAFGLDMFDPALIKREAFFKPRKGIMRYLPPSAPPPVL